MGSGSGFCGHCGEARAKKWGGVGDSARGSNAFTAAADIVISIRRAEGNGRASIRQLHTLSRFSGSPEELTIELTDDGFVSLGDSAAVAVAEAVDRISKLVPGEEPEALTLDQIVKTSGIRRTSAQKGLDELLADGRVKQSGKGVKGNLKCYWAPIHSAATPVPVEAE